MCRCSVDVLQLHEAAGESDPPQQHHESADTKGDTRLGCEHHRVTLRAAESVLRSRLCQANRLSTSACLCFWILEIHQTAEVSSVLIRPRNSENPKSANEAETVSITVGKLGQCSIHGDKGWRKWLIRDNPICAHLAFFSSRQQIIPWDKTEPGRDFSGKKTQQSNLRCKAETQNWLWFAFCTLYIFMSRCNRGLSKINTACFDQKKRDMAFL